MQMVVCCYIYTYRGSVLLRVPITAAEHDVKQKTAVKFGNTLKLLWSEVATLALAAHLLGQSSSPVLPDMS